MLFLFLGVLFVYGQISSRIDKITEPSRAEFNEEKIEINETAPRMTGYKTVALFGLDHRSKNAELAGENSDTIIIASINNDTSDVKLVSVYRDTFLKIRDETFNKANAAYAYGGPQQGVSMLNTNLDLDITDYITVDFSAVVNLVDAVGGLDIPLSYAEIVHMNNYCVETAEETGKSYTPIPLPEKEPEDLEAIVDTFHLNGVQATSYCRIRYTASLDMGRTERQRRVIQMVVSKLKTSGLTRIFDILDELIPLVQTSLSKTEILQMIPAMIGYRVDDTTGFPIKYKFANLEGGSYIVADTLMDNVLSLHEFLYGSSEGYTPSLNISGISDEILKIVGGESSLQETAPVVTDTPETANNFVWTVGNGTAVEGDGTQTAYDGSDAQVVYDGSDIQTGMYTYEPQDDFDNSYGVQEEASGQDYGGSYDSSYNAGDYENSYAYEDNAGGYVAADDGSSGGFDFTSGEAVEMAGTE